jgi:hypothetical protein
MSGPLAWRVIWANYTGFHDWLGRVPAKTSAHGKPKRRRQRPQHTADFPTRAEAEAFAEALRRDGQDEIVAQVVPVPPPPSPPAIDPLLPGSWPQQWRG